MSKDDEQWSDLSLGLLEKMTILPWLKRLGVTSTQLIHLEGKFANFNDPKYDVMVKPRCERFVAN